MFTSNQTRDETLFDHQLEFLEGYRRSLERIRLEKPTADDPIKHLHLIHAVASISSKIFDVHGMNLVLKHSITLAETATDEMHMFRGIPYAVTRTLNESIVLHRLFMLIPNDERTPVLQSAFSRDNWRIIDDSDSLGIGEREQIRNLFSFWEDYGLISREQKGNSYTVFRIETPEEPPVFEWNE